MDGVVIREATLDDAAVLSDYAARLFAEGLPGIYRRPVPTLEEERAFVRSYADPANSVLLIAEAEGEVVGVAGLLGRSLEQERHVGAVGISVASGWRGRGVGTALLNALLEWAPAHGVDRVELEAFSNNPRAISLYERLGFVREGVRRGAVEVDGGYVDAVCLARTSVAPERSPGL